MQPRLNDMDIRDKRGRLETRLLPPSLALLDFEGVVENAVCGFELRKPGEEFRSRLEQGLRHLKRVGEIPEVKAWTTKLRKWKRMRRSSTG